MDTIKMKAYAKVNLSLDILGKRPNGYHDVEMIMQQITLYDDIEIRKTDQDITIHTDCYYVPSDSRNIAYKIAKDVLEMKHIESGIHIEIKKVIPVAAGLAGGSADAAGVIMGLNILFDLNMSLEEMKEIAVKHGADIPFCIEGGAAVARGIGEELEVIPSLKNTWMVLVKPPIGVSTQSVYKNFDLDKVEKHPDNEKLIEAMHKNDYRFIAKNMYNVLEEVTSKRHSIIGQIESKMREYGALGTMMSGSGPTVFGIFKNYKKAETASKHLRRKYKDVFLVQAYDGGRHE
ncbi:4-(cytidine 5'-diphospho)-2-C-methyl-D-erythritol kinase [Acidaminobacter sp. JC074]|uniref:4-(cytidine 5'-diphospho)-2-C-methyl-D-erythritol kinase n=1 Tax=Acidaminobacter sp. JC074 TaxID=2530199 RepID=UPI0021054A31|nr:4-(cytidine 5'-diphospho)-2-C-methyl-D-erythritol kinase [Acidaminobacter sp. JC074]